MTSNDFRYTARTGEVQIRWKGMPGDGPAIEAGRFVTTLKMTGLCTQQPIIQTSDCLVTIRLRPDRVSPKKLIKIDQLSRKRFPVKS